MFKLANKTNTTLNATFLLGKSWTVCVWGHLVSNRLLLRPYTSIRPPVSHPDGKAVPALDWLLGLGSIFLSCGLRVWPLLTHLFKIFTKHQLCTKENECLKEEGSCSPECVRVSVPRPSSDGWPRVEAAGMQSRIEEREGVAQLCQWPGAELSRYT